jgi:fatty acid kinase fatty acid binding subunit
MPVRIVTDSSADLTADEARELGVEIVPLSIRFGADEYTDGVDLSVSEFYDKLAASPSLPETSAPSPGAFEAAYRRQAAAGADAVVCITLSSGLSATIQSAQNGAAALADDLDVRVVDSRSITAALGTLVRAASEAGDQGAGADQIVALVEDMASRTRMIGALDTLDNLKKGGRIGGAQALLGSLLSIKPLLDISTGEVAEAGRARTRRKALEWLRDQVFERPAVEHLTVCHGMAPDLDDMLALLAPRYPADKLRVTVIGPTIGTHGGPRVMGLAWVDPA